MNRGPVTAEQRLKRLLVMLPWVLAQNEVPVAEIAARFDISPTEVIADLERASMCGVPPYGPDDLVDLYVDDGVVYCGRNRLFTRALRLTAPEGFALLAAMSTAQQLTGAAPLQALAGGLRKLSAALGDPAIDVAMARPEMASPLTDAVARGVEAEITYQPGDDAPASSRTIRPVRVFIDRGLWYVLALDLLRNERRTFRIDRVASVTLTQRSFDKDLTAHEIGDEPASNDPIDWFAADDDLPRATLRVDREARWMVDRYPVESVADLADGGARVVLAVRSEAWLATLLLRAGPLVVLESPAEWADLARRAAAVQLDRYRSTS